MAEVTVCFVENPLAGDCVAHTNPCEHIPIEDCQSIQIGGRHICAPVERCFADLCDGTDSCCGLKQRKCENTKECSSQGQCTLKPGLDGCLLHR